MLPATTVAGRNSTAPAPHARSADSMLRDPKYLCFRIFCSLTRKLRGRRVEGRAKIARRFARLSVAPDAIIQIEFSAGNQGFVGPRQWVLGFWSGASNRSMDTGVQQARHHIRHGSIRPDVE